MTRLLGLFTLSLVAVALSPEQAAAYVGPGAGFALAGSFFAVFLAIASALLLLLTWPIRFIARLIFRRRPLAKSRFDRVVVLGLDGMDHALTTRMLAEGKLPHLEKLARRGCFKPLGTTLPAISPVAWSSFQTGVNPGKHGIFDFLIPDLDSYRPKLSSVEIRPSKRSLKLGKWVVPLGSADVRLMRKSRPFWSVLGEYGIFSAILRVPITFPPEKFRGVLLSAMCVPDLRGTQGMFSRFSTKTFPEGEEIGGEFRRVRREKGVVDAELLGPPNPFRSEGKPLTLPFRVTTTGTDQATLEIAGEKFELRRGEFTEWIKVGFRALPGIRVKGMCKFLLIESDPEFDLYVSPINIDPEVPAMPVSSPPVYSVYLAKRQGPFATLGIAEDEWALNEGVLDDDHFIRQCIDMDREREAMFFDSLDKVRRGLCVCVFDGTDRLQHAFWRDIDEKHPARTKRAEGRTVLEDLYRRMDDLVGRTVEQCGPDNLLMVISDHGFNAFRRGVDLNRLLEEKGYLTVLEGRRDEKYLAGVDWSHTKAFAVGLAGIYLNIKDKYSQGIVEAGEEADRLREEIAAVINEVVDPKTGEKAVKRTYVANKTYRGPYKEQGPDLIPGWNRGYRTSWDTAVGKIAAEVFHDNKRAWSGDHCIDPSLVPGILFCSHPIDVEAPRLLDVGPTILKLFGIPVPDYMDGKPWNLAEKSAKPT